MMSNEEFEIVHNNPNLLPVSPLAVANYFINLSWEMGPPLTPNKLNKLIYYAEGWHLAIYNARLLKDEPVGVTQFGPIINSVYNEFRKFGTGEITQIRDENSKYAIEDPRIMTFLDVIWEKYSIFDEADLSASARKNGTPWDFIWNNQLAPKSSIPSILIKEYFLKLIDSNYKTDEEEQQLTTA